MIYLDHAATTPVAREVADTMYDVLLNGSGNPSSQYPYGAAAKKRLEADRAVIAAALGCKPDELYFTSCGTESDNWAIRLAAHQNRRVGKHIITTAVEHSAVLEPCRQLEPAGYPLTYLAPDRQGNIPAPQVADALREDTALVSVMLVNNETGCVFPVGEIARLLREHGSKALLHTDAVQAFLKLPFRADTLGADLISVSGHKLNAPKGVGALYIGPRCRAVRPLLAGGGQERGLRSGTEATAQIAGFWWLRSPYCYSSYGSTRALLVNGNGNWGSSNCSGSYGIRPALKLNSCLSVSLDGDDEEEKDGECDNYHVDLARVDTLTLIREVERRLSEPVTCGAPDECGCEVEQQ